MYRPIDQSIVEGFRNDPDSMAVVEQLVQNYFDRYMAPEMDRVRAGVSRQQTDYLKQRPGLLQSMAGASNPATFDDPLTREQLLGQNKDLFKSPEDMVLFCKEHFRENEAMRHDLNLLTQAWREAAIIRVGADVYDRVSNRIGNDLASMYMDYRLSEMVLKKMVREQAPTSTVDYIVRKASEGTLFGISQSMNKTPMQLRIDKEGEQMLNPSEGAKVTARVMSAALDAPMTGVLTCWGSLIGVGALEVGMELAQPVLTAHLEGRKSQYTVEQILSQTMFSSDEDEFAKMRSQKLDYVTETNVVNTLQPRMFNDPDLFYHTGNNQNRSAATNANRTSNELQQQSVFMQSPYAFDSGDSTQNESVFSLNGRYKTPSSDNSSNQFASLSTSSSGNTQLSSTSSPKPPLSTNPTNNNVSSVQAQNKTNTTSTDERGKDKNRTNANKNTTTSTQSTNADGGNEQNLMGVSMPQNSSSKTTLSTENASQNVLSASENEDRQIASQWAPLIGQFGLTNLKDVGANLGLVLATLPDMLFGMFSKKDRQEEFSWSKNLIPLASLLLGFKFRNPLLKMLLVGFGGVGLIKNGMDNIASQNGQNQQLQSTNQRQVQFVPYPEQPLNPRIENLQINNNILVMDIDRVPYSVTLPEAVAKAYQSKALPLSTLANAVLQKYDQAVAISTDNTQQRTIHRYNTEMDMRSTEHDAVMLK